ncbi:MAG: type II secretion system protein, partial [Planctomycetota bacterium]|nr:type II secretion system protein [Planctomycetota bacterium]
MRKSHGFTLLELMITIVVIGILAAIVLAGVGRAYQSASAAQTKSTILKLHQIITQRWESFRYRRIPAGTERGHRDPNTNEFIQLQLDPNEAASYRLKIKRKLMRMELPDRW